MKKNIDRVHIIYLFFIWILITGFIAGISFLENDNMINAFSISSAIVSIIIGMIAIFITIFQGLTQGSSIQKLNESVERVEVATKKLESFEFEKMDKKVDTILDAMSNDFKTSPEQSNGNTIELTIETIASIFIKTNIDVAISYYFVRSYEEQKDLNMIALSEIFSRPKGVLPSELYRGSCIEYLSILAKANLLSFDGPPTQNFISLKNMDQKYIQAFKNLMEKKGKKIIHFKAIANLINKE